MYIFNLVFLIFSQCFFASNQVSKHSPSCSKQLLQDSFQIKPNKENSTAANVIFQSSDGGQTWQDISEGLPKNLQPEGLFEGGSEVYLRVKNGMYHSVSSSKGPVWEKELFIDHRSSAMAFGRSGTYAYHYDGHIFQKIAATGMWLPVFSNFQQKMVRTVFESAAGSIFVGCDNGLFKSVDKGKTWNHVHDEGWVMQLAESKGVLIATGAMGIMRSTDDGEHWDWVISEGGVGIAAERIEGGFAAITYNTESKTRRVRISNDEGKTWQPIDALLPPSLSIASIKQFGKYFFCGHPDGIMRSSDKGKTWNLLLPSIDKKVFNLYISGSVIYAIPRNEGC